MKAFLLVCLATATYAAPQVLLNNLLPRQVIGSPLISTLPVTSYIAGLPVVQKAEDLPVEEKEVEVESYAAEEPKVLKAPIVSTYGLPLAAPAINPLVYSTPMVHALPAARVYKAKSAENVEHTVIHKRSADPQLVYSGLINNGLVAPSLYGSGLVSSVVAPAVARPIVPAVYSALPATHSVEVSNAAVKTTNLLNGANVADYRVSGRDYAGKGTIMSAPGSTAIFKRSADAEADPAIVYSNLGYAYGSSLLRPSIYSSAWARPVVSRPIVSSYWNRPVYNNLWY